MSSKLTSQITNMKANERDAHRILKDIKRSLSIIHENTLQNLSHCINRTKTRVKHYKVNVFNTDLNASIYQIKKPTKHMMLITITAIRWEAINCSKVLMKLINKQCQHKNRWFFQQLTFFDKLQQNLISKWSTIIFSIFSQRLLGKYRRKSECSWRVPSPLCSVPRGNARPGTTNTLPNDLPVWQNILTPLKILVPAWILQKIWAPTKTCFPSHKGQSPAYLQGFP